MRSVALCLDSRVHESIKFEAVAGGSTRLDPSPARPVIAAAESAVNAGKRSKTLIPEDLNLAQASTVPQNAGDGTLRSRICSLIDRVDCAQTTIHALMG